MRWTAIETSDFHAFGRFLNGEDIRPVLTQRRDLGFNLLRVWTRYILSPGIGTCRLEDHPDLYERLPAFLSLCARFGLYVELTAFTGKHDFPLAEQPENLYRHWHALSGAVDATNVIVSLVNEQDQHNDDPQTGNAVPIDAFGPIPWLLCSHGSNGADHDTVRPFWNYGEYHSNGLSEWWRKNGHNAMELDPGPMICNEATRCPDNDSNPDHYYDAAAGAALLCAGSCFHSVNGKRSQLFEGIELACAKAHVAGAKSVPLEFQDGQYLHRSDLETPDLLRVYQRRLPDGRAHLVRIRT